MENIVIIGAGPAGISAALYAVRANLDPLVVNNGIGALEKAERIENYYGLEHPLPGAELFARGIAQAEALGVRIIEAQMLGVRGFDPYEVVTAAGSFETRALIFATGAKRAAPPVQHDPSLFDQAIRLPAGAVAAVGDEFVQTLVWIVHGITPNC